MLPARFWAVRFKESFGVGDARSMDGSRVSEAKVGGEGGRREGRTTRGEKGEENIDGAVFEKITNDASLSPSFLPSILTPAPSRYFPLSFQPRVSLSSPSSLPFPSYTPVSRTR